MNIYSYFDKKVNIEDIKDFEDDKYELAIVRYVLKEAAQIFYRNNTFFLNKEELSKRDFLYNRKINLNDTDDFSIVCNSYCMAIQELLKEKYNIEVELISPDNDKFKHIDLLLKTKKGNQYIIDPLMDLTEMQVGMRTNNFASKEKFNNFYVGKLNNVSYISNKELKQIDDSIHYTIQGMYMDDVFEMIKQEFLNLEEVLKENDGLSMELLGKKYEGEKLDEKQKLEIKLDFISKYLNNRKYINGIVDFTIYSKLLLSKIFNEDEMKQINSYNFFVDDNDIKDMELKRLMPTDENRKRGLVFEFYKKCYVLSLNPECYLKFEKEKWNEIVKSNNVFIKPIYPVRLLTYLKKSGADRNIVHHNEFLRLFSIFEQEMIDEGYDIEEIKKHIKISETAITTINNEIIKYQIEKNNLTVQNVSKKNKLIIIYEDEGRNIKYIDDSNNIEYEER